MGAHAHHGHGGHHGHHHDHSHAPSPEDAASMRPRLLIAFSLAVVIVLAQAIGSLVTGSLALLTDTAHAVTDASGLLVALTAASLMTRPATSRRTWGFRRMEVLAALGQSVLLLAVGIYTAVEGVHRLFAPPEVPGTGLLIFGVVGLVANAIGIAVLATARNANFNMRAAFLEVANDALGSLAVIVAAGAEWAFGWARADAIASLLIAVLMAPRALTLLRRSVGILMEEAPASVDVAKLRAHMMGVDGVLDVHDLHVAAVSSHLVTVTAHVTVTHEADGPSRDRIIHELGECACHHFPIAHSTFQLECPEHAGHEHLEH